MIGLIHTHFSDLPDPRSPIHECKYQLEDIIAIAILGVICGAEGWCEVELFGKSRQEWLKGILDLKHGIPSHDTFGRIFSLLDAEALQSCFAKWVAELADRSEHEFIAIDGKTIRRSYESSHLKSSAIHMVSAWASKNSMVFGQVKTSNKSNEITAIPELLSMLSLENSTISIDAMGCQKKIAKQISASGGDYILGLKQNHKKLYNEVDEFVSLAEENNFTSIKHDYFEEIDAGHGRIETRRYWSFPTSNFHEIKAWKSCQSVGCVIRIREDKATGKTSTEKSFHLLSFDNDAKRYGEGVRKHWGVENKLHWTLDVIFNEDQCRVRKGNAAQNFSVLRHLAINLLKKEGSSKISLRGKRKKAGWDHNFLLKILCSSST